MDCLSLVLVLKWELVVLLAPNLEGPNTASKSTLVLLFNVLLFIFLTAPGLFVCTALNGSLEVENDFGVPPNGSLKLLEGGKFEGLNGSLSKPVVSRSLFCLS